MTIAACYLSPEGVVLGADSTSSVLVSPGGGYHYLNYNQKLFQFGEYSTVGIITWGLGSLENLSYRTLIALTADEIEQSQPKDLAEIAQAWVNNFWKVYSRDSSVTACLALSKKSPHDPTNLSNPSARSKDEEEQFSNLKINLGVGFCIAGYWLPDRTPLAFQVFFDPLATTAPQPHAIQVGSSNFWGAPNMIKRLIMGVDDGLKDLIMQSGKWKGTDTDLLTLMSQSSLAHPLLPIRDAIDFVHSCIYSTIKAMKFSTLHQICGGPIEIAVITTDRQFRWVRHKQWDAAITEGAT